MWLRRQNVWLCATLLLALQVEARAQAVTVQGVVRDSATSLILDSALITLTSTRSAHTLSVTANSQGRWSVSFVPTGASVEASMPAAAVLLPNYPNPFNPSTTIRFSIPVPGSATLRVHTVLGEELDRRTLALQAGSYRIPWEARGSAGVLILSLEHDGGMAASKMLQLSGGDGRGFGTPALEGPPRQSSAPPLIDPYLVVAVKPGYEPDSTLIVPVDGLQLLTLLTSVHQRAWVLDLHNDVLEKVVSGYQLGVRNSINHTDIPRLRDGGVDIQFLALWPDPNAFPTTAYQRTMRMIDSFEVQLARNPQTFGHARSMAEAGQIVESGRIAGILAVEGGHAIEEDLGKLRTLHARGMRYLTITWNNSTSWAVAAADSRSATVGLSAFGRQVIRTMDSLGIVIDVSHTGIRTIEDILETTVNPIIASHSGARALRNHYRNLTDSQIVAIARRGGVVGVVFYPPFLTPSPPARIDTVVRHIEYIRALAGVDHVALGSDFDGIEQVVVGLEDVSRFPALTARLVERGWSPADLRKLLGDNALRVCRQVIRQ